MRVIAQILELAAPLQQGFHIKIENDPWMALVIEDIQQRGPNGHPSISIAHYTEQNGDLMRDPEMIFEMVKHGIDTVLTPYYFRSDVAGIEQYSASYEQGRGFVDPKLKREHESFARLWDRNLTAQGFLEAFKRQRKPPEEVN